MQDANCDHAGRRGGPVSLALEEGSRKPPAGCVWLAASPTYRQSTDAQAPATHRDPERSRGWTGHPGAAGVDIAGLGLYARFASAVALPTMKHQMTYSRKRLGSILIIATVALGAREGFASARGGKILLGNNASALEQYAARELQRYLYQVSGSLLEIEAAVPGARLSGAVFVLGRRESNPLIAELADEGKLQISAAHPGPQGYVLKKVTATKAPNHDEMMVIAGSDETGCLYGVYGLLQDYYGIGFYLGGDVLPDPRAGGRYFARPQVAAEIAGRR